MINFKNILYALTCLSFSIIVGAGVYEHTAVFPQWSAAPPASLAMFQGEYGLNAVAFWTKIHPLTLLLFITCLALFWNSERRKNILISFIGYIMIILATALYFVPELIDITNSEYTDTIDEALKGRADFWEKLSLFRLLVIIVLAVILYLGLSASGVKKEIG